MYTILIHKLHSYLIHHNPELILNLEESFSLRSYLEEKVASIADYQLQLVADGKPAYIIEELCMNAMTKELRPSKFLYLRNILEEEFPEHYLLLKENGTLTYEVVNLITASNEVFDSIGFTEETEGNRILRYATIGVMKEYMTAKQLGK